MKACTMDYSYIYWGVILLCFEIIPEPGKSGRISRMKKDKRWQVMRMMIILVALAVTGISGAWEETNYLNYQFKKTIDTQAGENLQWLSGVQSSAHFYEYGPYGYSGADVGNYASGAYSDQIFYQGQSVDTSDVLTQYGSAKLGSRSSDLQTPGEVMSFGSATSGQNMAFSGLFNYVQFWGSNYAQVGLGKDSAYTYYDWANPATYPSICIWANDDSRFSRANMGTEATVGFEKLMAPGALSTMSGDFRAWGGFDGAYDPTADGSEIGFKDVDISVDFSKVGTQGFMMTSWD